MSVNVASAATDEIKRPLGVLESSGLIRLAAVQPELEYLFRHVLVQDAAYETLLKQERRRLHLAVAETLETLYPERRDELAGMLAWHFESAGEPERALPLLIAAGGWALRRFANSEAYAFFQRASAALPPGDDPAVLRHRVEIGLGMARSGWLSRSVRELLDMLGQVAPLAHTLGDPILTGQVQLWTAIMLWQRGDVYEEGTDFHRALNQALDTAHATGDEQLRGMALTILGRSSVFGSDPQRSIRVLEEAIEITQSRDPIGSSLAADSLAMAYATLGDFDKADTASERSYELARRSGDPIAIVDAQLARSQVEAERGNLEEALRLSRDGAARAATLGVTMCTIVGNFFAGAAELGLGRANLSVQPFQLSRDLAEGAEAGWWQNMTEAALSTASCELGDLDKAHAGWKQALDRATRTQDIGSQAAIRYQRAVTLARTPKPDWPSVVEDLEWSIDFFKRVGARPREARARTDYAGILDQMERPDEAAAQRARAEELFLEMGLVPGDAPVPSPG
jgi:tetratricopeptide (TPR) repeat protein